MKSQKHRRRGMALIWVAFTGLILIAIVALAGDSALVFLTGHQLQNAADAGALAGAWQLRDGATAVRTAATNTSGANQAGGASVQLAGNPGNGAGGDIVIGFYNTNNKTFSATLSSPNAVRVLARRTDSSPAGALPLIFGPMAGVDTSNVSRFAIAVNRLYFDAAIITLDPTKKGSFRMNGNPQLLMLGSGGIQNNSNHATASEFVGNSFTDVGEMRVTGGYSAGGNTTPPDEIVKGVPPVPDPLAGLPAASKGTNLGEVKVNGNQSVTINPGYYSGGLTMTNGNLTLNPGIYVLGPPGLKITGGNLNAQGVMFYITKATGNSYGTVTLTGNGTITITPPTSGTYQGVSFFEDRTAPDSNQNAAIITGTSTMNIQGTIYLPSIALSLGGTSNNISQQIIVDTLQISGNGVLKVNYDGRNKVEIDQVYLVE